MIKRISPKKKKLPLGVPQIAFQIMNTILVSLIVGFLIFRGYKYKLIFDGQYSEIAEKEEALLREVLVEKGITDIDNFLSNKDGTYTFINNPKYNYVLYSGRVFRVLDVNADGETRMVDMTIEGLSIVTPKEDFTETALFRWLNVVEGDEYSGIYEKSLEDYQGSLVNTKTCVDRVDEAGLTSCKLTTSNYKVALLTFDDYSTMGGNESYVNTKDEFWLSTNNEDGNFWFVNSDGAVSIGNRDTQFIGIRPVITLTSGVKVSAGEGTLEKPFVVYTEERETVSDLSVAQYINYSDKLWRVVRVDENGNAELFLNDYIRNENGDPVSMAFGSNTTYNTSNGIGAYLNDSFLKSLQSYETICLQHDWNSGTLLEEHDYDYHDAFEEKINAYVGLPNTSTLFLNTHPNIALMEKVPNSSEFTYVLDEYNHLYQQFVTKATYIRPLICVKGDVKIASGDGTAENPYFLELVNEETGGAEK